MYKCRNHKFRYNLETIKTCGKQNCKRLSVLPELVDEQNNSAQIKTYYRVSYSKSLINHVTQNSRGLKWSSAHLT